MGLSMFAGYSYNERPMLSLGMVDRGYRDRRRVTLTWGEEDGGSKKTTVERHKQIEIRAVVSPVPYAKSRAKSTLEVGARRRSNSLFHVSIKGWASACPFCFLAPCS